MRKLAIALACLPLLAVSACVTPYTAPVGTLSGLAGSAVAGKVAKSSTATTALSIACGGAEPILAKAAATAFPAAAPYLPAAQSAFNSFCAGALPQGTSTTAAARLVNTTFAFVLGTHLMDI